MLAVITGLALAFGTGGCASVTGRDQRSATDRKQLNDSLNIAAAAAAAGQFEAAERLYTELLRHFPDAPEPRLGLGELALRNDDFSLAGRLFGEAEERSTTPAAKASALLGAGRAALGRKDATGAKKHFLAASDLANGTPAAAWVANGLGVAASLEGAPERARKHFEEAVKLSSSHPMITANLVRTLAQSGESDEARRLYAKYSASHWLEDDAADLQRLLKESRETDGSATASGPTAASGPAAGPSSAEASTPPRAQVQLYAARSRAEALAAWARLASEEKELLGSLSPRVVKVRIPEKGVFYRLRAGLLSDKAAARRLCDLLKGRGRDCFVPLEASSPSAPEGGDASKAEGQDAVASSGILVQLYAARSRAEALAAWARLANEEKELLGSLSPRVVKVRIPEKGVFYRLFAFPLPDLAGARRLCTALNARGRGCLVRPR